MGLKLTRKVGEAVVIGKDIKVRVTFCRGGMVGLDIEAPENVQIAREELAANWIPRQVVKRTRR